MNDLDPLTTIKTIIEYLEQTEGYELDIKEESIVNKESFDDLIKLAVVVF